MGATYTGTTGTYAAQIASLQTIIETQALMIKGLRVELRDTQIQLGKAKRAAVIMQVELTSRRNGKHRKRVTK